MSDAMLERFPPGTAHWGWNVSFWNPGCHWVNAEEGCDALSVVLGVVADPILVATVPWQEAMQRGAEASA